MAKKNKNNTNASSKQDWQWLPVEKYVDGKLQTVYVKARKVGYPQSRWEAVEYDANGNYRVYDKASDAKDVRRWEVNNAGTYSSSGSNIGEKVSRKNTGSKGASKVGNTATSQVVAPAISAQDVLPSREEASIPYNIDGNDLLWLDRSDVLEDIPLEEKMEILSQIREEANKGIPEGWHQTMGVAFPDSYTKEEEDAELGLKHGSSNVQSYRMNQMQDARIPTLGGGITTKGYINENSDAYKFGGDDPSTLGLNDPLFALLTGGRALANEGINLTWQGLKNIGQGVTKAGDYVGEKAFNYVAPKLGASPTWNVLQTSFANSGVRAGLTTGFAGMGYKGLTEGEHNVGNTIDAFKNGYVGEGLGNLAYNVLDASMLFPVAVTTVKGGIDLAKDVYKAAWDAAAKSGSQFAKEKQLAKALDDAFQGSRISKEDSSYSIYGNAPTTQIVDYGKASTETPMITSENAADKSADSWEAAYSRALNNGDVDEAQRIAELRFKTDAIPVTTPEGDIKLYHATKNKFNSFDLSRAGEGSGNTINTEGVVHLSPYPDAALDVFKTKTPEERAAYNVMELYANNPNPVEVPLETFMKAWTDRDLFRQLRNAGDGILARGQSPYKLYEDRVAEYEARKAAGKLGMFDRRPDSPKDFMEESVVDGYTINSPNNLKSAAPYEFDNNGWLIPITERFHFDLQDVDIRGRGWFGEPIQIPQVNAAETIAKQNAEAMKAGVAAQEAGEVIQGTTQASTSTPLYSSLFPIGNMADDSSVGILDVLEPIAQAGKPVYNLARKAAQKIKEGYNLMEGTTLRNNEARIEALSKGIDARIAENKQKAINFEKEASKIRSAIFNSRITRGKTPYIRKSIGTTPQGILDQAEKAATRTVDFSKMSQENMEKFLAKSNVSNSKQIAQQYDPAKGYFEFEYPYGAMEFSPDKAVTVGDIAIKDLATGKVNTYNLKFDNVGGKAKVLYNPSADFINVQSLESGRLIPNMPADYQAAIQRNIDYVTKNVLPGSKIFGSSSNIAKGNLMHGSHDIDVIMTEKMASKHPEFGRWTRKRPDTYGYNHPNAGEIDVNVIREDTNGKAVGELAHELYSQLYPKRYRDLMMSVIKSGKTPSTSIPLDISADELYKTYDPVTKGILDAFASSKGKHAGRALYYLHYGNIEDVEKGFNAYANYILGGDYKASNIGLDAFNDPVANSKIIDTLIPGGRGINKDEFIHDPRRMKLLLDFTLLDDMFFGRGVSSSNDILKSLTYWYPNTTGGTVKGVGLNTVVGGNSGYGDVYASIVPERFKGYSGSIKDIEDAVRSNFGEIPLSEEDIKTVKDLGNKYGIRMDGITTLREALARTSGYTGQNYKDFIREIAETFDIPSIKNGIFGDAPYASLLEDLPESSIKQFFFHGMDRPQTVENRMNNASGVGTSSTATVTEDAHAVRRAIRNRKSRIKDEAKVNSETQTHEDLLRKRKDRLSGKAASYRARTAFYNTTHHRVLNEIKERQRRLKQLVDNIKTAASSVAYGITFAAGTVAAANYADERRIERKREKEKLAKSNMTQSFGEGEEENSHAYGGPLVHMANRFDLGGPEKNFWGLVNPAYHENLSTITVDEQKMPINELLDVDKDRNRIKVRYTDKSGNPVDEWILPAENFWAQETAPNTVSQELPQYLTLDQARQRHANIAQSYFNEAPTLPNLYNGAVNWLKSKGILEPEGTGMMTGTVPTPNKVNMPKVNILKSLPIDPNRYYRYVDPSAIESYKDLGVISQFNKFGIANSPYKVPMFTKGEPSPFGLNRDNVVWAVSKSGSKLSWPTVSGTAVSPTVNGEFNKAPISEFEFFKKVPNGYVQLGEDLNLPGGIPISDTPHIDYLKTLDRQGQLDYLVKNGLNEYWLPTLEYNPSHLESNLSNAVIPGSEFYAAGGPLVQQANMFKKGGPKKKEEIPPYYGIYGNVSPYQGEGSPILQYDADADEWYSDTWSDDRKRVKEEEKWYKAAPESFRDNYRMIVDPYGDRIKYVSPEKAYAGSWRVKGLNSGIGSSWSGNSNSYVNPFEEEKIIDDRIVWPIGGEFEVDGQQVYTDGEGNGYTEYELFEAPNYAEGGQLNTKQWNDLSIKEKAEMMKVAVRNGITTLSEIRDKYNEFAEGGNLYGLGSQLKDKKNYGTVKLGVETPSVTGQQYAYDILPSLFAMDGVKIFVTSGFRPNAKVRDNGNTTNRVSRHSRREAADIVGDFDAIKKVLDDPNSHVSRWMLANGYGYLDETSATGTAKHWVQDGKDHSHFHIGKDSALASQYASRMKGVPQVTNIASTVTPVPDGSYLDIAKHYIKQHEGWSPSSYADGKGLRSIGWGFNDSGSRDVYPQGISAYYDQLGGITQAQAEKELDRLLNKTYVPWLEKTYGQKWTYFTPNQKASIIDTAYQRPDAVGRDSQFFKAIMNNDPYAVNYLGVKGYDARNAARRSLFNANPVLNMDVSKYFNAPSADNPLPEDMAYAFQPSRSDLFFDRNNILARQEQERQAEQMAHMQAMMDRYAEEKAENERQQALAAQRQEERNKRDFALNLALGFIDWMGARSQQPQESPMVDMFRPLVSNLLGSNMAAYGGNLYDGETEPTGYLRRIKDADTGETGDVVDLNPDGTYNVRYSSGIQPMALQIPEVTVVGDTSKIKPELQANSPLEEYLPEDYTEEDVDNLARIMGYDPDLTRPIWGLNKMQEQGLQSISPEFTLLTMGIGGLNGGFNAARTMWRNPTFKYGVTGTLAGNSAANLAGPNGFDRTIRLFREGHTDPALWSLAGDLFDASITAMPYNEASKVMFGSPLYKLPYNAYKNIRFARSEGPQQILNDVRNASYNMATYSPEYKYLEGMGSGYIDGMRQAYDAVKPRITFNPFKFVKEGGIGKLASSQAYYSPRWNRVYVNPLSFFKEPTSFKGLLGHEYRHPFQGLILQDLAVSTPSYFGPNPYFKEYDLIAPFEEKANKGLWAGSPDELDAEMYNWKLQNNQLNTRYYDMDAKSQYDYLEKASKRFGLDMHRLDETMNGLSKLGYFSKGGKLVK